MDMLKTSQSEHVYSEIISKAKTLNDTKFSMETEEVNQQMWSE